MLPNMSPIFFTLGYMGYSGINLDYTKMLIATVAVGIVVDDTIHFVTRYHHEFDRCKNYAEALCRAFQSVGRAMCITTLVLVSGFMIFTLSLLESMTNFGLLISLTVSIALAADFLLMPALILKLKLFGPETPAAAATPVSR
jgi:predicted RND superfamily exporter protein